MSDYPQQSYGTPPAGPAPAGQGSSGGYVRVRVPSRTPYVTYTIMVITILVYMLQLVLQKTGAQLDWATGLGALRADLIHNGQLWRLLTPMLLHASIPHIFFNMYAVYVLGPGLEQAFGRWRFFILYVLSGFAGNVLSFLHFNLTGSLDFSVGASTAIFGLIGAEGVFLYLNRAVFGSRFRSAIQSVITIVVLNLLISLTPGIDIWGHIGGLLGGLLFTWFASPLWEVRGTSPDLYMGDKSEPRNVITGSAIVILIFGALALWGINQPFVPK